MSDAAAFLIAGLFLLAWEKPFLGGAAIGMAVSAYFWRALL